MKIPYNRLHVRSNVLFAARGGKIHTFDLLDGSLVSTWKHPDVDTAAEAIKAATDTQEQEQVQPEATQPAEAGKSAAAAADETEPPSKRQKVSEDGESKEGEATTQASSGSQKKPRKSKDEKNPSRMGNVPDRPIVTQLTSSPDSKHLIAVTGHDKAVWVFEHNGAGNITQLSKRVMPKRPSAITVSPDAQIICADKFGDVYALPLIISDSPNPKPKPAQGANLPKPIHRPSATVLTVHSKGNRSALANQERQLANKDKATQGTPRSEAPDFDLTLLLGHVSMLTALLLAEKDGRRYILTSDRDEHVRVSRYIPQAHVIEGYCLGHKQFIGDMVIPSSNESLLVSGGGDDDLYVWDWLSGKLLSTTSVLSAAKEVAPDVAHIAVSGLSTLQFQTETGTETFILAICENISAIFTWTLVEDNTLTRPGVIQLPGKPLHLATAPPVDDTSAPGIIVAMHTSSDEVKSLSTMRLCIDDGRLAVETMASVQDETQAAEEVEASEAEVRSLFYTVEHLRKYKGGAAGDEAGEEAADADDE